MKIYGASWCGDCKRILYFLGSRNIKFEYVDIDQDPDAKDYVASVNPNGFASIPVVEIDKVKILIEPTVSELEDALKL